MPELDQETSPAPPLAKSTKPDRGTKQWTPWITAAAGIVGIAIGGYIQFYTTALTQREAQVAELRRDAYAKYFEAQVLFQSAEFLKRKGKEDEWAAKYADAFNAASFRVGIYGTPQLIAALLEFHRKMDPESYKKPCREGWQQGQAVLKEMRISVFGQDDPVKPGTLYSMVLRCGTGDVNAQ